MTVKTFHLADGRKFRLGRKAPVARYGLQFSNYLKGLEAIPPAPNTADYTPKASTSLSQMYLNDQLGDCVIAGVEHVEGVLTGNANPPPLLYTDAQTKALYSAACGYVDGDPHTDQGCDIQTVLSYWQNHGQPAGSNHRIVGFLAVDPKNIAECQLALWLFENLIFGVGLPDAWVNPMPNAPGFTWDVAGAADMNNGHCFTAFGYDSLSFTIATWGMLGKITNGAISKYAAQSAQGELYTVISQEQLNNATKKAPNGLDWTSLVSDFNALGGKVVVPPSPLPTPNTTPNTTPSVIPGSQAWMQLNLSPTAYVAYVAALTHPVRSSVPGTPGWLISHMSAASYGKLVSAYAHREGSTFSDIEDKLNEFYAYLRAEYTKITS
jgi:hypothetical protein